MKLQSLFIAFAFAAPWAISAPAPGRQEMHFSSRLNRTVTTRAVLDDYQGHQFLHGSFDTKTNQTRTLPSPIFKRSSAQQRDHFERKSQKQRPRRLESRIFKAPSLVGGQPKKAPAQRQSHSQSLANAATVRSGRLGLDSRLRGIARNRRE